MTKEKAIKDYAQSIAIRENDGKTTHECRKRIKRFKLNYR